MRLTLNLMCNHSPLSFFAVSDGPGKGTADAVNGIKATDYLCRAERLLWYSQPFSWVLIRPPWASNLQVCCKACVCNKMKERCENAGSEVSSIMVAYLFLCVVCE